MKGKLASGKADVVIGEDFHDVGAAAAHVEQADWFLIEPSGTKRGVPFHRHVVRQAPKNKKFNIRNVCYRVGSKKVNLIVATCWSRPMWEMVIECLLNTF